jgi:CXXX repeat peptide maturase
MLTHLISIVDKHATSFCCYENEAYYAEGSEIIAVDHLKRIIDYARQNDLAVNFLYGNKRLPDDQENLIESVDHVRIVPLKLKDVYPGAVLVINRDDQNLISSIPETYSEILILRVSKDGLKDLADVFKQLGGRFKKLNLCLLDIEGYGEAELAVYSQQLKEILEIAREQFIHGHSFETSFITDRLVLDRMNNCDAGQKHITVTSDGNFYLCPGFYFDNGGNSIGSLDRGLEIKNHQLLSLDHAPICSLCDAYHCRRCLYLNKKITLEINTPSRQQCVLSHLERETSRNLLNDLRPLEQFYSLANIPELDYIDPFTLITSRGVSGLDGKSEQGEKQRRNATPGEWDMIDPDTHSIKELLLQIYSLQLEILKRLDMDIKK